MSLQSLLGLATYITKMTYLVLNAVISCKICGVELENQKLKDSPIGPYCLYCNRAIQYRLGLSLTDRHAQTYTV